jgi:hypothetical protein
MQLPGSPHCPLALRGRGRNKPQLPTRVTGRSLYCSATLLNRVRLWHAEDRSRARFRFPAQNYTSQRASDPTAKGLLGTWVGKESNPPRRTAVLFATMVKGNRTPLPHRGNAGVEPATFTPLPLRRGLLRQCAQDGSSEELSRGTYSRTTVFLHPKPTVRNPLSRTVAIPASCANRLFGLLYPSAEGRIRTATVTHIWAASAVGLLRLADRGTSSDRGAAAQ